MAQQRSTRIVAVGSDMRAPLFDGLAPPDIDAVLAAATQRHARDETSPRPVSSILQLRLVRPPRPPDRRHDFSQVLHPASLVVPRNLFDGVHPLRHFGKTDSEGNRRNLQNRMENVQTDSLAPGRR
jgi:hypothetical protein